MSQVRRRRALRCSVVAASLAVLASLVVAPPASAADAAQVPSPTAATTTGAAPEGVLDDAPGTGAPTTATTPSAAAPTTAPPTAGTAPSSGGSPETTSATVDPPVDSTAVEDATAPEPGEVVVGELQQAWPDPTAEEHAHETHDGHDDHAGEEPLSWIDTGDGTAVRVPTDALPDVAVGSTISVTVGDPVPDEASTEQGFAPAVDVQAATVLDAAAPDPTTASAGSTPTNTVTAVLVLPAGATSDGTAISTVVNTLNGDVASFWDEQSNGTVRISAVQGAAGWISSAQGCSTPFGLWDDVARQIGWTEGAGKHLMLYVPRNAPGCAYGLGTVGSSIGTGGYSYVQASRLSVMGHELGHNFGLGHSSELQCDSSLESGSCRTRDYWDYYDIMGISWDEVGTLNTAQAARLGLLPSAEQVAVTSASATTTVTLSPVSATTGTRALRLTTPRGAVYYMEYRQASGRDGWLGDARNVYGLTSGVVLRRASAGANTSLLLDATPSSASGWGNDSRQSIPVGSSVVLGGGNFTVTVVAAGGTAQVRVEPGSTATRGDLACATRQPATTRGVGFVEQGGVGRAFAVGDDGAVWTRSANQGWQSLGGAVRYGPVATTAPDGTVYVAAAGTDAALYVGALRNGAWSGWDRWGGATTSSPGLTVSGGVLRAFVSGADGAVWTRSAGGGWSTLGGGTTAAPTVTTSNGATSVSVRGTDGRVWSQGVRPDGSGDGWTGGDFAICSTYALPAVQPGGSNAAAAFTDAAGGVWVASADPTAVSVGGRVSSAIAVVSRPGSFAIAGRGSDGALWVYVSGQGWQWWGGTLT